MATEDEKAYLTTGKHDQSIKIEWECAGPTSHAEAKALAAAANQKAPPPTPTASSGSGATISLLRAFLAALVVTVGTQ